MPSILDATTTQTSWKLILNVNTRWNSTFNIIKRALCLRNIIDAYINKEVRDWKAHYNQATKDGIKPYPQNGKKKPSIVADALSNNNWKILKEYMHILEPLKEVIMILEGKAQHSKLI
jgi:hypothetical protein